MENTEPVKSVEEVCAKVATTLFSHSHKGYAEFSNAVSEILTPILHSYTASREKMLVEKACDIVGEYCVDENGDWTHEGEKILGEIQALSPNVTTE